MSEYKRIDISKGIDINKTNKSKECMLCHYWYFLDKNFSYGPYLCDGCYNMMQKCNKLKNIAIVHIKESVYRIYFLYMSKREAKKLMENSNLIDKKGVLLKKLFFFCYRKKWIIQLIIKETEKKILNRAKDYYENDKERLKEQARNKYRNLSEEDNNKKREYGKNGYHNMPKEKKHKLKEYQKR